MSDLADGLIELDVKIIKTLRAVHGLLEQRTAAVEDITQVGAGMLGMMQIAQLRNDENIIDAVYDVLSASWASAYGACRRGSETNLARLLNFRQTAAHAGGADDGC